MRKDQEMFTIDREAYAAFEVMCQEMHIRSGKAVERLVLHLASEFLRTIKIPDPITRNEAIQVFYRATLARLNAPTWWEDQLDLAELHEMFNKNNKSKEPETEIRPKGETDETRAALEKEEVASDAILEAKLSEGSL